MEWHTHFVSQWDGRQEKHISEVLEAMAKAEKEEEAKMKDKIYSKMNASIKNREEQVQQLKTKLQAHVSDNYRTGLLHTLLYKY